MNRREWMIAVPVLCALAGSVAGFMHGVQIEASIKGIAALRALDTPQGGRVAVVAAQALHVLDADGKPLVRQELQALGLQDAPNDMDLTLDAQGQLEAWFVEDVEPQPRVLHCAWNEAQGRMAPCVVAAQGPQLKWNPMSRAVHLAIDRQGQRMFIADAKGHRVQVFDLAGKRLAQSEADTLPLYYPNRLRYLGNDQLAVADNDHRRLLWAEFKPGAAPRLLSTLEATDHPQARSNRTKVTDAAFGASGTIWMLAVKQGQKDGDVLVFDAARKPVARVELPEGADPLVVEALGDTAIVADYSRVQLYRVDVAGRHLGEFGGAALQAELAPKRELALQARLWTQGSLIAGGVVIVAGLLLAWRFSERPVPAVRGDKLAATTAEPGPPLSFPVVLDLTPEFRALQRKQAWGLGGSAVLLLIGLGAWLVWGAGPGKGVEWMWPAMASVPIVGIMIWMFVRDVRYPVQLRISASRAGLFRRGKCIAEAPLAETFASETLLLVGSRWLIYQPAKQGMHALPPMFDMDLLNRALLQRMPGTNWLDGFAMGRKLLVRQPLWMKLMWLAIVVFMIVVIPGPVFRTLML